MCKRIFKNETSDSGDIPFYKIGTFGGKADAFISNEKYDYYKSKFSYPNKGDILLSASGTIGRIVECTGEKAYFQDSNIVWLNHNEDIKNVFLKVLYPTVKWDGIEGSTIKRLYNSNFLNTCINIPNTLEQEKIGELFTNLDNLITLHQRKYTYIFYSWEQRKLGEVGYAKSGQGFPDAEQGGTRGIPFYKVSDMNITGNENELITANNYVTQEQIIRNHWNIINDVPAVFFAKVGAAVMLNRKRLCRNSFLLDNNTMAYMFDKSKWNYNFGKTMFDTIDLTLLAQVGAIPSYNASDVENIEILMPHLKEQGKIGELFTNLDSLITLHQHKELKRRNDNNEHLRW